MVCFVLAALRWSPFCVPPQRACCGQPKALRAIVILLSFAGFSLDGLDGLDSLDHQRPHDQSSSKEKSVLPSKNLDPQMKRHWCRAERMGSYLKGAKPVATSRLSGLPQFPTWPLLLVLTTDGFVRAHQPSLMPEFVVELRAASLRAVQPSQPSSHLVAVHQGVRSPGNGGSPNHEARTGKAVLSFQWQ